jgi:hypothetical protein
MSYIQTEVRADLESPPHMHATAHIQALYLDEDGMAWIRADQDPTDDPGDVERAAAWFDTLATEAAKLAAWYRTCAAESREESP